MAALAKISNETLPKVEIVLGITTCAIVETKACAQVSDKRNEHY